MKRFKAVHLTTVHSSSDVRIFHKECQTIAEAGYDVTLIAGRGQAGVAAGVKVRGLGITSRRWDRMTRGLLKSWRMALSERGHIYQFHDPELIPVGLLLKLAGKKVIYDVHEDFAASLREGDREWVPPALKGLLAFIIRAAEQVVVGTYDAVVAATPKIASFFPREKTVLVRNYPLAEELVFHKGKTYSHRPRHAVYAGGISERRGIREMIRAFEKMGRDGEARLLLAGEFSPPALARELRKLPGWEYVDYFGCLSREALAEVLGGVRVGLVLLHPIESYIDALPIKLFEYMSAGIPVIASDFPRWREILTQTGAGIVVDPQDGDEVVEALRWIFTHEEEAEQMGRNGAKAVAQGLNWSGEGKKLLALYDRLLESETERL